MHSHTGLFVTVLPVMMLLVTVLLVMLLLSRMLLSLIVSSDVEHTSPTTPRCLFYLEVQEPAAFAAVYVPFRACCANCFTSVLPRQTV